MGLNKTSALVGFPGLLSCRFLSQGLSVLLMQRALEALRLRAEAVGFEEARWLLKGVRNLQVKRPAGSLYSAVLCCWLWGPP